VNKNVVKIKVPLTTKIVAAAAVRRLILENVIYPKRTSKDHSTE
jgi:hypothetical protein